MAYRIYLGKDEENAVRSYEQHRNKRFERSMPYGCNVASGGFPAFSVAAQDILLS